MITTRCLITFTTHTSHISVDQDSIQVFKYTDRSCDFDIFDSSEQLDASDYILTPPDHVHYYVTFPGEIPPHLVP
jgi:hypothetical protein